MMIFSKLSFNSRPDPFDVAKSLKMMENHNSKESGRELKLDFENIIIYSTRIIIPLSKMGSFTFSSFFVTSQ